MESLGKVVRASREGLAVVMGERESRNGAMVVDARLQPVGRVVGLVGRIDRPYALIKLDGGRRPQQLVGTTLYLGAERPVDSGPRRQERRSGAYVPRAHGSRGRDTGRTGGGRGGGAGSASGRGPHPHGRDDKRGSR